MALGTLVAIVRFWFSSNRTIFHIAADEPAQFAMARWLSGGTRWNMFDHSTWRPGMGTLLAPLFWFTDDTTSLMRGGLAIAAVLGGVGAMLLAVFALRITPMTPRACWFAAAAIALTPSSLSATSFVWAEGLVTIAFIGSLWLVIAYYDGGPRSAAIGAIVVSVLGFVAHGRLLPLVAIVAALVIGRALWTRRWGEAVALAVVSGGWTVLGSVYASWIFSRVWDEPGRSNTVGTVVGRLPRVRDDLASALGQVWYQLVATAGLTVIGLAVVTAAAVRRRRGTADAATATATATPQMVVVTGRHARLIAACTVPLLVVSMVFMASRTRVDHRIYGRYNDAILWPVLLVAIAWLVQLRRTAGVRRALVTMAAIGGATVGAGAGVRAINGEAFADSAGVRPMISGLLPFMGTASSIEVLTVSLGAVAVLAVILAVSFSTRRGAGLAALAVVLVAVAGVRTHEAINLRLNSWQPTTRVAEIDNLVPPDTTLGVKFVRDAEYPKVGWDDQRRRIQLYQFSLPNHLVLRDRGVDDDVGPYVFAPLEDPELEAAGAAVVWRDPTIQYALWREPDTGADTGGS